MKKLTTILSVLVCFVALSQNSSIIVGNQYRYNGPIFNLPIPQFSYGDPTDLNNPNDPYDGYDGQVADHCANIITKPNGEINFFIVDGCIYDRGGQYIDHLRGENSAFTKGNIERYSKDFLRNYSLL